MPLVDSFSGKANKGLWEVRSKLASRRIARLIFAEHHGRMVLLHGFIKKSQQTPKKDLDLALRRYRNLLSQEQGNE
jgi:phage-related protein